ncbi:kynurenine 3-monooxygenase [Tribolium castaneum]|uniref:Kynurenine 3-monooxygenase n=3 Tax=Tribolium castaneum TaxID=7070 RepID=Q95NP6_TRICA|nr:kynurenine 3-monooxygenase [Tribolium castaneum]AAL15465.1 kynurenine 3-monooxygenase [Tribolium castaneum]AAL15467.1 kynurenine 3-monooxygenase [Tribolium castaneum]|eukprot:NP_001034500.1 kynurenine 3-monooxygenase [Tribolium castaneum]
MGSNNVNSVIVVGGGLVGSLCAIFMAKRGYHVTLFEYREDIRTAKFARGRSINMALSNRGRKALRAVGIEKIILESAIPMKGRLLHDLKGRTTSVPYDALTGQCIYSISRDYLNNVLLTELEKYPNVKIYFNHKLMSVSFEDERISVMNLITEEITTHQADLIIEADGAYSTLRRYMQLTPLFEYSQTYIQHGYLELVIPPENGPKMTPNHLHIWPRGQFMMIALPNKDNSWTVTLFMPFGKFESLRNAAELKDFYYKTFPDAVPLIGEDLLVNDFFKVKPSALVSVKCKPYHVGSKFLLIGDAAHAMVPFYGQGMNAGFEDCFLLDGILERRSNDIAGSIEEFSRERVEDAYAICELAMYNYVEMRDLVTRPSYRLRKFFDELLFKCMKEKWIPLCNSVTFSNFGYKQCVENRKWQNKVIQKFLWTGGLVTSALFAYGLRIWLY